MPARTGERLATEVRGKEAARKALIGVTSTFGEWRMANGASEQVLQGAARDATSKTQLALSMSHAGIVHGNRATTVVIIYE